MAIQPKTLWDGKESKVKIPCGTLSLEGTLRIPRGAEGIVLFVHGSGSSQQSPRNKFVAQYLNENRHATLLFDLLTKEEEDEKSRHLRFDIEFLTERLLYATDWVSDHTDTSHLNLGYFGASTGAAAALVASVKRPVHAVVSRGGRPDLAGPALVRVQAPTLFIVGGMDSIVIPLNEEALKQLSGTKKLEIIPGATHLFEEKGTLEEVARLASNWFDSYLRTQHHSFRTG